MIDKLCGRGGAIQRTIVGACVAFGVAACRKAAEPTPTLPATAPAATQPATRPPTTAAIEPKPPAASFIDVVKVRYPALPTTQPLSVPLKLSEAARLVLPNAVYAGPSWRVDLWITDPAARPTDEVLREALDRADIQVHVTREKVRFAHWSVTEGGQSKLQLIVEPRPGVFEAVSLAGRRSLNVTRNMQWERAQSVDDRIVVPADTGVSVWTLEPKPTENFFDLADPTQPAKTQPQMAYDGRGMLAWLPWENGKAGGKAARLVDGEWTDLSKQPNWNRKFLHLIPLRDGSVLQLVADDPATDRVKLALTVLQETPIDEEEVKRLVEQLADSEREKRDAAFAALSQFGTGVFPLLQKLSENQPPEARARLRQLLRTQVRPTLGGMTIVGDQLRVVSRQSDGGAVFYAEKGVTIPTEDPAGETQPRAWLAVRPGRAVELLPRAMTDDLKPDETRLTATADGWVAVGDVSGPKWWVGNGFVPLLRKSETAFNEFLGRDRRGRWLFRNSVASSTTRPSPDSATLILDPTLPNPTPRLPYWNYRNASAVGWDADGWPAATYGGGNWALHEDGWVPLDKEAELLTRQPAATRPATDSTRGPVLLTDADGARYYDGHASLVIVAKDGQEITWPLPPTANGSDFVTLLRPGDGPLFLFNQLGRVLRLRPTPGAAEPFRVDATFTRGVPSTGPILRIWTDPAGRIAIVHAGQLTILFPGGYIPPKIQELMDEKPEEAGP